MHNSVNFVKMALVLLTPKEICLKRFTQSHLIRRSYDCLSIDGPFRFFEIEATLRVVEFMYVVPKIDKHTD